MTSKLNRYFRIAAAFAVAVLLSGLCNAAQIVSEIEDTSPALRIKNNSASTMSITIATSGASANNLVVIDLHTNTVDGSGSIDTIAELAAAIAACTNAAGASQPTVDADCSLAADSTDGELLDGTYTAAPGAWLELPWDTSSHLSFDLYFPSRTYQAGVSAYVLGSVLAAPGGTGNVTASIYKAGVLIAKKTVVSPVYVNPATWLDGGTNVSTNSFTADAIVNLDWTVNMPFMGTDAVIVRVARATSATTGVISGVIPNLP